MMAVKRLKGNFRVDAGTGIVSGVKPEDFSPHVKAYEKWIVAHPKMFADSILQLPMMLLRIFSELLESPTHPKLTWDHPHVVFHVALQPDTALHTFALKPLGSSNTQAGFRKGYDEFPGKIPSTSLVCPVRFPEGTHFSDLLSLLTTGTGYEKRLGKWYLLHTPESHYWGALLRQHKRITVWPELLLPSTLELPAIQCRGSRVKMRICYYPMVVDPDIEPLAFYPVEMMLEDELDNAGAWDDAEGKEFWAVARQSLVNTASRKCSNLWAQATSHARRDSVPVATTRDTFGGMVDEVVLEPKVTEAIVELIGEMPASTAMEITRQKAKFAKAADVLWKTTGEILKAKPVVPVQAHDGGDDPGQVSPEEEEGQPKGDGDAERVLREDDREKAELEGKLTDEGLLGYYCWLVVRSQTTVAKMVSKIRGKPISQATISRRLKPVGRYMDRYAGACLKRIEETLNRFWAKVPKELRLPGHIIELGKPEDGKVLRQRAKRSEDYDGPAGGVSLELVDDFRGRQAAYEEDRR